MKNYKKNYKKTFINNFLLLTNVFLVGFLSLLLSSCNREKTNSLKLINVLDKNIYDDVHIAGSEHINFEDLDKKIETDWKNLDKNTIFIFYCTNYACSASGEAAKKMEELGFKNSYAYEGGMAEWFSLHKQDKSYRIIGNLEKIDTKVKHRYLTLPNPINLGEHNFKIISADELKKLLL